MSRINKASPSIVGLGGRIAVAACLALLAGCGSSKPVGTVGYVKGFGGLVAAGEPRAVLAARDVLSAGGTAADAATTLYFSLAVTLPSTASLGGGGSCVAFDAAGKSAEVVDFTAPEGTGPGTLPVAAPANARGFYLLHARYGKLRWQSLLAEPERMAREGITVSRAFASDLALGADRLARDPVARQLFFRPDGHVLGEGDLLQNLPLAETLSELARMPGDFYAGAAARRMAAAAQGIGAGLTVNDLALTRPREEAGVTRDLGDDVGMVPANAASAGSRPPGTGFVVLDSYGSGVACAVSANGLFGSGRMLPGTGFFLAAPGVPGRPAALPALIYNANSGEVHFAATAAGGADPAAALGAAMRAANQGRGASEAVAAAESGLPAAAASRMEAFACASGTPDASRCSAATDPRGFGYAVAVGKD